MKKRKNISPELKARIMSEANIAGCVISKIATKYNISAELHYAWRSSALKVNRQKNVQNTERTKTNFVKLALNESTIQQKLFLKKASLKFENFSLGIEGSINIKKLMQIMKTLEQPC